MVISAILLNNLLTIVKATNRVTEYGKYLYFRYQITVKMIVLIIFRNVDWKVLMNLINRQNLINNYNIC